VSLATQAGLRVGMPADVMKNLLKRDDILQIKDNLEKAGRDRLANDEEEVYIFWMPERNAMC